MVEEVKISTAAKGAKVTGGGGCAVGCIGVGICGVGCMM